MRDNRDDDGENERSKIIRGGGGELFNRLPEGCVAAAISFTGPRDACRLASVSTLFKSAAYYDAVWDCFLPSDYRDFIARSDGGGEGLESLSKRDLFLRLAHRPLLIDASTKSFFLDKSTGKKCFTISARELVIIWGDTPRYWSFHSFPESRFPEVAELHLVCWLEIKGKLKASMLSPDTTYTAYLVFKMTETAYGFYSPAQVTITTPGGQIETQKVYLKYEDGEAGNPRHQMVPRRMILFNRIRTPLFEAPPHPKMLPRERLDRWLEVEIGELFIGLGEDGEVEMSVMEVAGNWKSGLIVEGLEIRPKVLGCEN
ncbi:hypothetical protein RND81_12G157300 [Saponaria officinalis]|uniref:F-box domain-containing protein n=1 Tax=Saponaria officinalis TaxID=3572 RepID=A0AAW1HB37_SAPOF